MPPISKHFDRIGGIGESIAENHRIPEYRQDRNIFEKLKHKVPFELLELMDVTGFGPATLKVLHEQKGINNRRDLIQALEENKLGLERLWWSANREYAEGPENG